MTINIQYVKMLTSETMNEYVKKKLNKLGTKFDWVINANVFFKLENDPKGEGHICEIELSIPGPKIFASSKEKNFELAAKNSIKDLTKQLEKIKIKNVINDKTKNKIKDKKIGNFILRQQILNDFPPKELRSVIDQGKKDIKNGIIISISIFEEKVGVAIGVTNELVSKYDAVNLVKIASEILDGKGGGGRKDFAQAGGTNKSKIDDAFKAITNKIS